MIKEQSAFLADVARLIQWLQSQDFIVTGGELYRPQVTQDYDFAHGLTRTHNSNHNKRLAIDLNIFEANGQPATVQTIAQAGAFWEGLALENRWGGKFTQFPDWDHFERNIADVPGKAAA